MSKITIPRNYVPLVRTAAVEALQVDTDGLQGLPVDEQGRFPLDELTDDERDRLAHVLDEVGASNELIGALCVEDEGVELEADTDVLARLIDITEKKIVGPRLAIATGLGDDKEKRNQLAAALKWSQEVAADLNRGVD